MPKPKTETPSDEVVIKFNDAEFTVPRNADDWPTVAYLARIKSANTRAITDWMEFIRLLVGPVQWELLTTQTATTTGQFKEFLNVFSDVVAKECDL